MDRPTWPAHRKPPTAAMPAPTTSKGAWRGGRSASRFSWGVESGDRLGLGRVRKEELLAVDPVAGDAALPGLGQDPVDEALAVGGLHMRVALRIDQHHAILVEQPRIALDKDPELLAVAEGKPGAA